MSKREETDERAMLASSLVRQDMTREEIARYLGITDRQVRRLLARARQFYKFLADNIDGKLHLGETLTTFLEMERKAWHNLAGLKPENPVAVGWAKLALDARKEIKKLLQECGAVFKMPETVEDGVDFEHPDDRKDYLALMIRSRSRGKGARPPGGPG